MIERSFPIRSEIQEEDKLKLREGIKKYFLELSEKEIDGLIEQVKRYDKIRKLIYFNKNQI